MEQKQTHPEDREPKPIGELIPEVLHLSEMAVQQLLHRGAELKVDDAMNEQLAKRNASPDDANRANQELFEASKELEALRAQDTQPEE